MKRRLGGFILFLFLVNRALACGGNYSFSYLQSGHGHVILDMPDPYIRPALEAVVGKKVDWRERPLVVYYSGVWTGAWKRTLDADTRDLCAAMYKAHPSGGSIDQQIQLYQEMRCYIRTSIPNEYQYYGSDHGLPFSSPLLGKGVEDGDLIGRYARVLKPRTEPIDESLGLDLTKYASVFSSIPVEFSLYVGGAVLYRVGRYEQAISIWEKILQLPPEERQYRSTWAAFMIGKAYMQLDPDKAVRYFEKTQALAAEGFRDSLRLGPSSVGWIAFVESRTGKTVEAFRRYYEMWTTMDEEEQEVGYMSLQYLANRLIRKGQVDAAVVQDPLCVRILMICMVDSWADIGRVKPLVDQLVAGGGISIEEWAGRLAWKAYRQGHFDSAADWVNSAPADCPYAKYTHSKLLMRDGDFDEAIALLREIVSTFPTHGALSTQDQSNELVAASDTEGQLGVLLVSREEYVSAMEHFLAGYSWLDAAYLAERVLTVDEVEAFIIAHEDDPRFAPDGRDYGWDYLPPLENLKYLLGRRLFREGQFEKGMEFLPEEVSYETREEPGSAWERKTLGLRAVGKEYAAVLQRGRNASEPTRARAECLLSAARIALEHGMELMSTETRPDWRIVRGDLDHFSELHERRFAANREMPPECPEIFWVELLPKPSEKERVKQHTVKPDKRFHYRYVAAELMWEAAELLPDDDPMTGRALYDAGICLTDRDPEAAYTYYKALVRRCRKLPIGQRADELRWFPKEATDADFQPPVAGAEKKGEEESIGSPAAPSGHA